MSMIDDMIFQIPLCLVPVMLKVQLSTTRNISHALPQDLVCLFEGISENQTFSQLFALTDETCTSCLTRMLPISSPRNLLQPKQTTMNEKKLSSNVVNHFPQNHNTKRQKNNADTRPTCLSQSVNFKTSKWNKLVFLSTFSEKPSCLHKTQCKINLTFQSKTPQISKWFYSSKNGCKHLCYKYLWLIM